MGEEQCKCGNTIRPGECMCDSCAEMTASYDENGAFLSDLAPPTEGMTMQSDLLNKYRKKPVVIEAWLWDETHTTRALLIANGMADAGWDGHRDRPDECRKLRIRTLEGVMRADAGDWIIKGVKGEFYPCKPDIFAATYEPASTPACKRCGDTHRVPNGNNDDHDPCPECTPAPCPASEGDIDFLREAKDFVPRFHPLMKEGLEVFVAAAIEWGCHIASPKPDAGKAEAKITTWMQHNYALCCEIARLEHELAIAVKSGHKLSTERGPYATELLSLTQPAPAASQGKIGGGNG